jgi:signal transduction histidine kinase/DNA-binding response OmpR family regulator/CHASE3 domain sensor protein
LIRSHVGFKIESLKNEKYFSRSAWMFWNRKYTHLGLTVFLVILISVVCLNSWILYLSFEKVSQQEFWVRHSQETLTELNQVLSATKDAETAIRGYILSSGDDSYLEIYSNGSVEVWNHINRVQQLTLGNPQQQTTLGLLRQVIEERLHQLSDLKKKFEAKAFNRSGLDLRDGKVSMDRVRSLITNMQDEEESVLAPRVEGAREARRLFYGVLLFTFALSVVVIVGAYRQMKKNQERVLKDSKQKSFESWLQTNMAQVSQLASEGRSVNITAKAMVDYLANVTQAVAAHFYTLQNGLLQKQASYADSSIDARHLKAPEQIPANSLLIGEALNKESVWLVKDIPQRYLTVSSSLGEADPRHLAFIPLHFQGAPVGVVEMALFHEPSEDMVNLLNHLREPLSVGLSSALSRERLQSLLEETQQQAEELQQQQEELRAKNEELEEQTQTLESQQMDLSQQTAELERSRDSLEAKARELQKVNQYKSEFLAKMSHELRTPLNSLLILSTLLQENKERNLTDQQKEFAHSIQSAGNDLLNLINDILDLSKIEARKLSIQCEEFTLQDLLNHLQRVFLPQMEAKGLPLKFEISPECEELVLFSDRQRLEQIMRNLLSNAIKFTEKGSITVKTACSPSQKTVTLSVIDTGVGIPSAKLGIIFDAFEQADGSVSRKFGGTGLGLTISRELAALLGGQITLQSEEGVGSQFTLTLPLRLEKAAAAGTTQKILTPPSSVRPTSAPESEGSQQNETVHKAKAALTHVEEGKNTILIVEDDDLFRRSVAETAKGFGFQTIEATTGEMAIEILQRHTPSAILLDIKLPGMSGLGLLEMVKQMPGLRHVPIHMLSALDYQQNALRMGALGYLSKPVTLDKIRSVLMRIEALLDKRVKHVLVIEDDQRQNEAIRQLIGGNDVEITTAVSGNEAIQIIESSHIDCIILDLTLPDISGFAFLEKINSLNISLPPIVIYTGKDLSAGDEERLRRYSESIIIKGARSPERLLDEVNLFLHRMESLLPQDKQNILANLRAQEAIFENKSILLVDDDLRNVFALTSALESKGFNVRIAKDGYEALETLDAEPVDIVLMDLMMPRMDGLEAIRRIRAQKKFAALPIVALTAKAMKEDHENCIAAGANDYLPKPINLTNLMSVIRVWVAPRGIFQ